METQFLKEYFLGLAPEAKLITALVKENLITKRT